MKRPTWRRTHREKKRRAASKRERDHAWRLHRLMCDVSDTPPR